MKTDQEIIDNAPEGAVCIDVDNDYFNANGDMWSDYCKDWDFHDTPEIPIRSLADIKRIVELEKERDTRDLEQKIKGSECVYEEMEVYSSAADMRGAAQRVVSLLRNKLKALKGLKP